MENCIFINGINGLLITDDSCAAPVGGHAPEVFIGSTRQGLPPGSQAELCPRVLTLYPKISVVPSCTAALITKTLCLHIKFLC